MEYPDHRRLGRQLGIFTTDERVGAGLPLWLPAGASVRAEIERYIVELERRSGYLHVSTPHLAKVELYEQSGHWAQYQDDMYPPMQIGADRVVLRPMNCPHHILVFAAEPRTARDIPFRLAELGTMFRYEQSGAIGGLSRVRQMTLNDGHVFCAVDDIAAEIAGMLSMVEEAYRTLAIPPPAYRLSRRGPEPKYLGSAEMWQRAEAMLRAALDESGLAYTEVEGEAAFYGPKIDLQVRDPQGRQETLSTIQVDFYLPGQFELAFQRGADRQQPVLIHRSIVSTMERMVAHLLEVHDGRLPVWLAPTQVAILPVVDGVGDHARHLRDRLRGAGVRVELDDRDATLGARVRDAQRRRIPYLAIIGNNEAADGTVAVRLRTGEQLPGQDVASFVGLVTSVSEGRLSGLLPPAP
jgi:threonyl-tRNA synthetase